MKTGILLLVISSAAAAAAGFVATRDPARPAEATEPRSVTEPTSETPRTLAAESGEALSGEVREAFDVAQYTYLRLRTSDGVDVWAAVSKAPVSVGSRVAITNASRMTGFESATLKRTFEVIYFGQLEQSATGASTGALPPGHPPIEGHDAAALAGRSPHGAPAAAPPPPVKVPPATGKNGRTIAQLFAEAAALDGKTARVRGQIVKATPVQGVTYYRLRDGSSDLPATAELVVSSQATANVGDVITFEGSVRSNVDVGIGIAYPVMLQDAQLLSE